MAHLSQGKPSQFLGWTWMSSGIREELRRDVIQYRFPPAEPTEASAGN